MKNIASRTGIGVAVAAAAMSVVFASYVPYGYPWPSIAWAALACAAAVWMAMRSSRPTRLMSDVLRDVDAESPRTPAASGR